MVVDTERELTIMVARETISLARRRDGLLEAALYLEQVGWRHDAEVIREYAYRVTSGIENALQEEEGS